MDILFRDFQGLLLWENQVKNWRFFCATLHEPFFRD